jgi:hypothetical protein
MNFPVKLVVALSALLIVAAVLLACDPTMPLPTTTTINTTTTTTVPVGASQTAALQAQLNTGTLNINSTVISDGSLFPPAGATITFGPNGKLVRSSASTGSAIDIGQPGVTLNNVRIQGPDPCYWVIPDNWGWPAQIGQKYSQYDPTRESQHGIAVRASQTTVNGAQIESVWGDALYLDKGSNIQIRDLVGRCMGRSGISNVGSTDVTVIRGSLSGAYWWIFNIEPWSTRVVNNYTVSGIQVGYSRVQRFYAGGPDFNCLVSNVDISQNTILPEATQDTYISPCVQSGVKI